MSSYRHSESEGTGGAPLQIRSATSPSAVSSSTEEEGGVRLSAPGSIDERLGTMSVEDTSPGAVFGSRQHIKRDSADFEAGLPQGPDGFTSDPGVVMPSLASRITDGLRVMRNPSSFQLGQVPDDGDVFLSPSRLGQSHAMGPPMKRAPRPFETFCPRDEIPTSPEKLRSPSRELRSKASDLDSRHQVDGVDAQEFYAHTACVFVANLPESVRDSRLEAEVTKQFSQFGSVFVKIRRDPKNMPFAFCQYTTDENAQNAMVNGKGLVISGRACRTEMARANRTFIVYRCDKHNISIEEGRAVLEYYGPMDRCEQLHSQIQEAMNLPQAVLVEFTKFDPTRDVVSAFRHDQVYRVVSYDPKKSLQSPKLDADEAYLRRYEVDRRSIFIGNLPSNNDDLENNLKDVLSDIGDVMEVQVIRKEARNGYGGVFAFVEFARPDMAEFAVRRLSGTILLGCRVRVERKNSRESSRSAMRHPRSHVDLSGSFQTPTGSRSYQSPAVGRPYQSPAGGRFYQTPDGGRQMDTQRSGVTAADPLTPLRPHVVGGEPSSVPSVPRADNTGISSAGTMAPPATWTPYTNTNPEYSSPNYAAQAGAGGFPTTPQGTPQGMMSPYGYYPAYSWAAPYLTDPTLAPMAYYHSYAQMPMPEYGTGPGTSHEAPGTPTKIGGAASGDTTSHGNDDGES